MVDFIFVEFWKYTVLTFKLLFWLVRWIGIGLSRFLNGRQQPPSSPQGDLFTHDRRKDDFDEQP